MRTRRCSLVLAGFLLAGCADGTALLVVDLRTDLVPGIEFRSARLTVDTGEVLERDVLRDEDFAGFRRLFETQAALGTRTLRLELVGADGEVVAARPVIVGLRAGGRAVSLIITRGCRDLDCPSGQACFGNACVDPACSGEEAQACGPEQCTSPTDCPTGAPCVAPECALGVCALRDRDACSAGEFCHPADGCSPDPDADAGAPRDAGVDASVVADAGSDAGIDAGAFVCRGVRCVTHDDAGLGEYDTLVMTGGGTLVADASGALGMTPVGLRASAASGGSYLGCVDVPMPVTTLRVELLVDIAPILASPPMGGGESAYFLTVDFGGTLAAHVGINTRFGPGWDVVAGSYGFFDERVAGAGLVSFEITRASAAGAIDGHADFSGPGLPARRVGIANTFWTAAPTICVGAHSDRGGVVAGVSVDQLVVFLDE